MNTKLQTDIVIYQSKEHKVKLETRLQGETIWLTQAQLAALFGTQRPAITKHLNNIFKSGELSQKAVSSILEHTAADGKTYKTLFYNLDAALSVGYRVNSKLATQFRIWATQILKQHILKGYTLNRNSIAQLKEKHLDELKEAVSLVKKTIEDRQLSSREESGLLRVITEYANSWVLLHQYDQGGLAIPKKTTRAAYKIEYAEAVKAIAELKRNLMRDKQAAHLFGQETNKGLYRILGAIYQTFDKKELYPSLEAKAAHLLYFVIKDHPFADGNKRIGSFLFIVFLSRNKSLIRKNGERKINDNTLVALALLIAESSPHEKEMIVKLIMNFLVG